MSAGTLLVVALALRGCASPAATTSVAGELRDFARFVQDVHPDPYRFASQSDFEDLVEAEALGLAELAAPDELRVARSYHRVLAKLRDSHLAVGLPSAQADAASPVRVIPLLVRFFGDRAFVDAAPGDWPRGTELLAIDSETVTTILDALAPLVISEGTNPAGAAARLHRDFVRLYHLHYGSRPGYVVQLRTPDGTTSEQTLTAVSLEVFRTLRAERNSLPAAGAPNLEAVPLPFVHEVDGQQVLRIPSFGVADTTLFADRVGELFAILDPARPLIIDVRGNEGGLRTNAIPVLNRLLPAPYTQWTRITARVRRVPDEHRPFVSFPFGGEERLRQFAEGDDGEFVLPGDPLEDLMVPVSPLFENHLLVLVDGLSNSATNSFVLTLVAHHPDVLVAGEELGGECGQHIGEQQVVYTTPRTGLFLLMSMFGIKHIETPGCERGRGLVPGLPVTYRQEHFLAGKDPFLITALEHVSPP